MKDTSGRPRKNARMYENTSGNREITEDYIEECLTSSFGCRDPHQALISELWQVLTMRLLETDNPYLDYADAERSIKNLKESLAAVTEAIEEISALSGSIGRGHGVRLLDDVRRRYDEQSRVWTAPRWEELADYSKYIIDNIDDLFTPAPAKASEPYHETIRRVFSILKKYELVKSTSQREPALRFMISLSESYSDLIFPPRTKEPDQRREYIRNVLKRRPQRRG